MISFKPLKHEHFSLLLKWLETPHVKTWWDPDIQWTPKLIEQKYASYVDGYKIEDGKRKPIHAFIILHNEVPIGYIQYYNAYDFKRSAPLIGLPKSLAAFDIFVGESEYVGRGIGSLALREFLEAHVDSAYESAFSDPDSKNLAAIRAYEKAGFRKINEHPELDEIWMLRERPQLT